MKRILSNKGVKVGDIFYASWGYDQTNVDFFRVKKLRGKTQVVLQEVALKLTEDDAVSSMASDRRYDPSKFSVLERSFHVKDNEAGAICAVKRDSEDEPPHMFMKDYLYLTPYKGQRVYESWYA